MTDSVGTAGAKTLHYRIDGGSEQTVATSGGNPGSAQVSVPAGTHTLEFWGQDEYGNLEPDHHTVTVVVDKTNGCAAAAAAAPTAVKPKPKPKLRKPSIGVLGLRGHGGSCTRASFRLVVRTKGVGLRSVRVSLDGRVLARSTHRRFTVTVPLRNTRRGTHVLRLVATSRGGTRTRTLRLTRCGPPPRPSFTG